MRPPMDHLYPFIDHYDTIMKPVWNHLWAMYIILYRPLWDHLWTILKQLWDHYETIYGPLITLYRPLWYHYEAIYGPFITLHRRLWYRLWTIYNHIKPFPHGLGWEGGQDKNAQEKSQVQDVLGTCLWCFPRCLWPGKKNINIRKRKTYLGFLYNHL